MSEQATTEQIEVIQAPLDTNIKVIAVAGSGKSWTMRRRVAYLLEVGVDSRQILVLMFNKSAQVEFDHKLKALSQGRRLPQTRTYHSLGYRLCESMSKKGFLPNFKLNSSVSAQSVLAKQALKKAVGSYRSGICNPNRPNIIEAFVSFIDLVKSDLCDPEEIFDRAKFEPTLSPFIGGFSHFEDARKEKGERFFSDLIYDPVTTLINTEQAKLFVSNRLNQIIIDEYQDINRISQELIKLLAGESACVTAVGDDDQTLYGFRGSNPEYLISRFDNDFTDPLVFKLTKTFRYGHTISIASNSVISNNNNRVDKLCVSSSSTPYSSIELQTEPPVVNGVVPQTAITNCIKSELGQNRNYSDIAILVRLFSMTPPIELALMRAGIPYRIEGRPAVFDLQEVQALTNLLRIASGNLFNQPTNFVSEALTSIFLLPHPGISLNETKSIVDQVAKAPNDIVAIVANATSDMATYISGRINRKADAIHSLMARNDWTPKDALSTYLEMTECKKNIMDMSLNSEDAEVLIAAIDAYLDFCDSRKCTCIEVADQIEQLRREQSSKNENPNTVLITSAHRSKGLEWPVVILPRLAEGSFPYIRDDGSVDIQSERRLFYVSMTRAINKLVLVVPADEQLASAFRYRNSDIPKGLYGNKKCASRFIYEANLRLSIELGQSLYSSDSYSDIETPNDPGVFNMYLTQVGAQFRISKAS